MQGSLGTVSNSTLIWSANVFRIHLLGYRKWSQLISWWFMPGLVVIQTDNSYISSVRNSCFFTSYVFEVQHSHTPTHPWDIQTTVVSHRSQQLLKKSLVPSDVATSFIRFPNMKTLTRTPEPNQPVTAWRLNLLFIWQSKDLTWCFPWHDVGAAFTPGADVAVTHLYTERDGQNTQCREVKTGGIETVQLNRVSLGGLIRVIEDLR